MWKCIKERKMKYYEDQPELGKIKGCAKTLPGCCCCKFTDNYIVLFPGEFEDSGLDKSHITIIDENYFGGKKAVCNAKGDCEEKFKPFDCKVYPYFPRVGESGVVGLLKGKKCPLQREDLETHRKRVYELCSELIKDDGILEWLRKVELVGYEVIE